MLMLCLQVSSTLLEALQLNSVQQEQRWRQQGKAEGGEIALKSRGSGVGSAAAAGVATSDENLTMQPSPMLPTSKGRGRDGDAVARTRARGLAPLHARRCLAAAGVERL